MPRNPQRVQAVFLKASRPGVTPILSDTAMLRSLDGILSRLPPGEMAVVASTQALGWDNIHGVITAGRLKDFFGYSSNSLTGVTAVF